jgi:3-hydroxy-9,10-secoandrosta-1,3,5(10)-triene-9,17-dione monooxygenase reductase component
MRPTITAECLRRAFGHLPTGVTVITATSAEGPIGMTANSVTCVSLAPPMLLFCPGRSSDTWPAMRRTGRFTVNVMAEHHEAVSRRFASKGIDRFADLEAQPGPAGPRLNEAVLWIDCAVRDEREAGDHTIVLADILAFEDAAAFTTRPLIFFLGRYGTCSID